MLRSSGWNWLPRLRCSGRWVIRPADDCAAPGGRADAGDRFDCGVGLAQSTVSKHLACLRDCGLVTSEPVGRSSLFRLAQPALADMHTGAETVLAATGNAVALCPVWGTDCCGGDEV
jgi:DNA-binding transcriptional ArsR family regulator